ncbi:GNAT family N-acetyltransferase [Halostella sp. JP-L12]|uniref:GNAT family N-acetyltransferase n=1 Tax=Halostella TaxID=1843185 RepID=UPI000EF77372|nr:MULTISPECIES: GNAT family N-acetyltransferase [Halostella]NHN49641.1 GNAT family N-acetyltransferase [Halostella sp. JP-L12]
MVEYRRVPDDRDAEFGETIHYAFAPEEGPPDADDERSDGSSFVRRGLFEGEEMLCVCKHRSFRMRLRGEFRDVAGLSAVATPPEHRRKGHVRRLLSESLSEYRERGDLLSALWPFDCGFYGQYGWATANRYATYEMPPESLAFAADAASGDHRPLGPDDWAAADRVYDTHAERFALAMDRTETWWRERVFDSSWRDPPYAYGWERDGELAGYVVYRVNDKGEEKTLAVREFAYADREARLNLLYFLYNHDSQVDSVKLSLPESNYLLDEVDDPAEVDCELGLGPMVRLVDVAETLSALAYPADGAVALAVSDPFADWNDGTFELAVEDGAATCRPTDAPADVELGVGALSQLVVGYRSAEALAAAGELDATSADALETLAALFPETDPFLREFF